MRLLRLSYSALLGFFFLPSFGYPSDIAIEAYGDSITAGFMSHTKITQAPSLPEIGKILSDLTMYAITKDEQFFLPYHHPNIAWPAKLAQKFEQNGRAIQIFNAAITGAETIHLREQVQSINQNAPRTYAFFLIGHNDYCLPNIPSPQKMAQDYRRLIQHSLVQWDQKHLGAKAYLLPIADIYRVYAALEGYVWYKGEQKSYSCEQTWEQFFPICRSFAKMQKEKTLESFLKPRIDAMNQVLSEIAQTFAVQSSRNEYAFLGNLHNRPYIPSYFALDCFHPSALAQRLLAEAIWREL